MVEKIKSQCSAELKKLQQQKDIDEILYGVGAFGGFNIVVGKRKTHLNDHNRKDAADRRKAVEVGNQVVLQQIHQTEYIKDDKQDVHEYKQTGLGEEGAFALRHLSHVVHLRHVDQQKKSKVANKTVYCETDCEAFVSCSVASLHFIEGRVDVFFLPGDV